ncbi:MAG: DUF6526 family protein [Acidobacteriota bacterium]
MRVKAPQNYQNHRRFIPLYHIVAFAIFIVNAIDALVRLVRVPSWSTGLAFAVSLALVAVLYWSRVFALSVQDRVIRAEMRTRLENLLPPDLRGRIGELSRDQVVALRFASDGEMADLFREVLTNNIVNRDEIKRRIKNWEPDEFRA